MKLEQLIAAAPDLRLETERLILRRVAENDITTAIAHELDHGIMQWIRDPEPRTNIEERTRGMLAPWHGKEGQWLILAAEPKTGGAMIGIVCCRVAAADTATMEFGYRFATEVHRRGFGLESCRALLDYLFSTIQARKLLAFCVPENEASWRLMEKLGMTREATFREYSHLAGKWRDEYVYGLLRREWQ